DLKPSTSARSLTTMLLSAKGHHPSRHAGRTTIRLTLDSRARVRDNHSNTPPTTENTMRPIAATLLTAAAAIALTACSGADAQPPAEAPTEAATTTQAPRAPRTPTPPQTPYSQTPTQWLTPCANSGQPPSKTPPNSAT